MLWSNLVVSLSSKTWLAWRDVSKKAYGVTVYVTPLVQKQPQLKGMLLSARIHVDVKDTPSSQTSVKQIWKPLFFFGRGGGDFWS